MGEAFSKPKLFKNDIHETYPKNILKNLNPSSTLLPDILLIEYHHNSQFKLLKH